MQVSSLQDAHGILMFRNPIIPKIIIFLIVVKEREGEK
jgi:hypothetical protein